MSGYLQVPVHSAWRSCGHVREKLTALKPCCSLLLRRSFFEQYTIEFTCFSGQQTYHFQACLKSFDHFRAHQYFGPGQTVMNSMKKLLNVDAARAWCVFPSPS